MSGKERHALVTGAGSGIGRAVALALASRGHPISLAGRRAEPLEAVRQEIETGGCTATVLSAFDITDAASVVAGIAKAIDRFGDIAVLVNSAGEAPSAPFEKTDLALWNRVIGINLTGTYLVTQAALASIRRAGGGRIVNVASTAGQIGYAYVTAYCAAKHGVIGLTRALALETATTGVTVNAVCPGYTETPLLQASLDQVVSKTGRSTDDARAALQRANPQRRFIEPDEVARAVLWLALRESQSMTGQSISVSGGEVM